VKKQKKMSLTSSQISQDLAFRSGSSVNSSPRPSPVLSHHLSPRLSTFERLLASPRLSSLNSSQQNNYHPNNTNSFLSSVEAAILRSTGTFFC